MLALVLCAQPCHVGGGGHNATDHYSPIHNAPLGFWVFICGWRGRWFEFWDDAVEPTSRNPHTKERAGRAFTRVSVGEQWTTLNANKIKTNRALSYTNANEVLMMTVVLCAYMCDPPPYNIIPL